MKKLKLFAIGAGLFGMTAFSLSYFGSSGVIAQSSSLECQYDDDGCVNPKKLNTCGCEVEDEKDS